ncbi:sugar-binding domain-containing protein [Candidatus Galacturonibacter soehngenii]|uniref:Glycoside hydrolase family 2 catalytic domain-containing protein n=1 Tax=Candidatus Galacturonatibacter soehngenii TaxID=2307010 RepID=A0A7V7QMY5_9FIRM|nr:sugar-binding domain-containing protein [Candidatus Galacturonibacter soehngenii]KAB1440094.1 hypothetical protein F7O84_06875 [Candidatus Galacturonibacter soehngenii]
MRLDLSGIWEVAFEESDVELHYNDRIQLPSTTEQAGIGKENNEKTSLYLGRKRPVCGAVWYRRKFVLPREWDNDYVRLCLERSKFTKVWLDQRQIGESYETLIAQKYDLGRLEAGEHEILIRVDNNLEQYDYFPKSLLNGHQYTQHTQTNWNGILGDIYVESHKGIYVDKVLTHRLEKYLDIDIKICPVKQQKEKLYVSVTMTEYNTKNQVYEYKTLFNWKDISISVSNETFQLWDEYAQVFYEIKVSILNQHEEKLCEDYVVITGRRFVETRKHELRINQKRISLRGSLDCAIYPLTGACPFEVEEWMNILSKIKAFGMNHYRFHSWCPPEAAFLAADQLGMYLQVELSCFANGMYHEDEPQYDSALNNYLYDQSVKVIETFGNHPSFVLFAVGNEMVGNLNEYNKLIKSLKKIRTDIMYCQGANNFLLNPQICEEDQFFVTMRTKPGNNIRASFSHNDLPLGSIQTKDRVGTLPTYDEEIKGIDIPLIAHEIGQYQSFPLLSDYNKYKGPLRADVYTILEEKLKEKGLLPKNEAFYYASGALLVECYKAEIEANLRTERMSGFQLLGLQDFTGQGTALVGVLDSFLDNKGFIEAKDFRRFCNEVVVMATLPKYCFEFGEDIPFEIFIYNYSGHSKKSCLSVELLIANKVITSIYKEDVVSEKQKLTRAMEGIIVPSDFLGACEAKLKITYGEYENEYVVWLYPQIDGYIDSLIDSKKEEKEQEFVIEFAKGSNKNQEVWVTNTYNEKAKNVLKENGKVLLCTSKHEESIEGFFPTDFWCYPMFCEACIKSGNPVAPGTMGLLIESEHAAMKHFPTRTYSQWQWQQIVSKGVGVILDDEVNYHIIAQVIDNFDRNHLLGFIYEKKVENGRLLVCASDLLENLELPEVRQLYNSLLDYMLKV